MIVFILANSADPDEMQHYAAFHLGLHYLPNYPFRGFRYTNQFYMIIVVQRVSRMLTYSVGQLV